MDRESALGMKALLMFGWHKFQGAGLIGQALILNGNEYCWGLMLTGTLSGLNTVTAHLKLVCDLLIILIDKNIPYKLEKVDS